MRRLFDSYAGDRALIGEIYLPIEKLAHYYGTAEAPECHLPFNFSLIYPLFRWDAAHLAEIITRFERALPPHGWPNWVLGNHDVKRIATRIGPSQARVAAMLLLTLRGTPTIYQGDELSLEDVTIPPDRITDMRERTQPGYGRDPVRTPMPWSPAGGFTTGRPWLPMNADLATRNVESESRDPGSMLSLTRALLALRREPLFASGSIGEVRAEGSILRFERTLGRERALVVLNLSTATAMCRFDGTATPLLSTVSTRATTPLRDAIELAPAEGVVLRFQSALTPQ